AEPAVVELAPQTVRRVARVVVQLEDRLGLGVVQLLPKPARRHAAGQARLETQPFREEPDGSREVPHPNARVFEWHVSLSADRSVRSASSFPPARARGASDSATGVLRFVP